MEPLSAGALLDVWERGVNRPPVEQALIILGAAFPRVPMESLSRLTIGQRDACLLALRELTFGPKLEGLAVCPACGESLEMAFETGDLRKGAPALPEPGTAAGGGTTASMTVPPYELTFRLPDSTDLQALAGVQDAALARRTLIERCLLEIRKDGARAAAGDLPVEVLEALAERMSRADPLADLTLAMTCPACKHAWQVLFDIVSFFWSEINARAGRLLREVHVLASAYGWREADILAMSAWRRQHYLELVGA